MSFDKPWGNYLLENIIETQAPEGISFWPQTIAWKVIFILVIFFVVKKVYQSWKTYQDNRYRREALAWLKQCSLTNEVEVRQLPALLKKTALLSNELMIQTYKATNNKAIIEQANKRQHNINQLSGEKWLIWLDKHCQKTSFSPESKTARISANALLNELAYSPHINFNDDHVQSSLQTLRQQISLWVEYHQLSLSENDNTLVENKAVDSNQEMIND